MFVARSNRAIAKEKADSQNTALREASTAPSHPKAQWSSKENEQRTMRRGRVSLSGMRQWPCHMRRKGWEAILKEATLKKDLSQEEKQSEGPKIPTTMEGRSRDTPMLSHEDLGLGSWNGWILTGSLRHWRRKETGDRGTIRVRPPVLKDTPLLRLFLLGKA